MYLIFLPDKEQIGAKRRKKIPHFSDYFGGGPGGGPPPGMGGAGGGGFGGFGALGLLGPAFSFVPFTTNPGTSQSGGQGELFKLVMASCYLICYCENTHSLVIHYQKKILI